MFERGAVTGNLPGEFQRGWSAIKRAEQTIWLDGGLFTKPHWPY